MKNEHTLGSLFDGSGGFPLGGMLAGITPLWASEIEPFAVRVTTKRLPQMKHYGDVSALNGADLPSVDIITFGSPCQDMSIAGKRSGLDGSRSSLFYEAVRIIKEMRCATNGKYPRFCVWENVPGAFSSNNGEDFRAVLESLCRVKDESISVPRCEKWTNAGEILADGFSIAWRVLDAQYWGVPQRRKRIFLVADFDSECAGKILFESEGLSGYSAEGFKTWKRAAAAAEGCTGTAGAVCLNDQGGNRMDVTEEVTCTLRAEAHHPPCVMESAAGFCTEHSAKARGIGYEDETSPKVTEELLYDNAFGLESYIIEQFGKALSNAEEDAFLNGDGVGKPLGLLSDKGGGEVAITTASATAITADEIINLVYSLKRPYRKNAKFIMNDQTIAALRKLKDNNGAYLWQPSLQAGEVDRLFGYEVYTSPYVPIIAAGKPVIAFGDFSYYNIGDRGTRSFAELKELYAGNGMVGFVAKERVDGKLILPEAVQILKMKAGSGS